VLLSAYEREGERGGREGRERERERKYA